MKRGTFRAQTLDEVRAKQTAKRSKLPQVKSKPKKRTKLPSLKSMRDKADGLLTPVCKKHNPNCESCGQPTQVGHHWIEKSRSNYLRYDLRNLVALCHSCHAKIHNRFGNSVVGGLDVAEIIINKRGRAWKEQLDKDAPTYQKVDRLFYTEAIERLSNILNTAKIDPDRVYED